VRSGWRASILSLVLLLLLVGTSVCRAAWDFTAPGEPNRNWSAALSTGGGYDDNFYGTQFNRQSGFRYSEDLTLRVHVPWERSLLNGQYDYGVVYPHDTRLGGVDQTHNLNISENFSVNPRLLLSANENFVDSLQPQLVQTAAGVSPTVVIAGAYIYNIVGAGASYSLTPRWTASISGSWDIWRYAEALYATNNDHEDYSMTLSALYSVDPRTTVGVNYQYGEDTYTHPGPDNSLNAFSDTGYLSLSHQFNPQLALVLNGGYTVRNAEDGSTSTGPSAFGSLTYNYGPLDSVVLIVAESLNSASVGITRSFSAQQSASADLQLNHRFTVRFHTVVEAAYVDSTFSEEIVGAQVPVNVKPTDQSMTAHWGLRYDFRQWLSAGLDYNYTRVISSDVDLVPTFSRDQINVSLILTY
jgi:hypothetical protein